jgi:mRNA-degrading endonuclease RelE of RelBE toxin-antitoxin system
MVEVVFCDEFKNSFRKIKDSLTKEKLIKQIEKIKDNPSFGKPLKYRRGERTIYVKPYRLIYSFSDNILYLLKFEHRKSVYGK